MKYISHLDLRRVFIRALRRAKIHLKYSEGFNPHPRLIFAAPLAVGWEGEREYVDLYLLEEKKGQDVIHSLNNQMPEGLEIKDAWDIPWEYPPISAEIEAGFFEVYAAPLSVDFSISLKDLLKEEEVYVTRRGKKGEKQVNIRPFVYDIWMEDELQGALYMLLATGNKGGTRPEEVFYALGEQATVLKICRKNVFMRQQGGLIAPDGTLYRELRKAEFKAKESTNDIK